jgi:hypothetical protein
MTKRLCGAAALMLALICNASTAQSSNFGWGYYQHPNRCMVWDGYQWLNMCWRPRAFAYPAWARLQRFAPYR